MLTIYKNYIQKDNHNKNTEYSETNSYNNEDNNKAIYMKNIKDIPLNNPGYEL